MIFNSVLQIAVGTILAVFLPGLFITLIFFEEMSWIEKIALSIALSIATDISIGIFLGYNENMKALTGGLNEMNVWTYSLGITGFLFLVLAVKKGIQWIRRK